MIEHGIRICKFGVLVLPLLTMAACSDDDDDFILDLGINTDLNGTWVSGCQIDSDGDGEITTLVLSGTAFQAQNDVFMNDSSCATLSTRIISSGTFQTGADVQQAAGAAATEVDINFQSGSVTYFGANVISSANANAVCGRSDWQDGVSFDATECLEYPSTFYDIYRVDGNTLYLGDESGDGDTPESRPTGLDLSIPYSRSGS